MTPNRGFTLIEIIIALIIFALIASMTAVSMQHALKTQTSLNAHVKNFNTWQTALTHIEKDIQNQVNRPFRTQEGQHESALLGSQNSLELTRGGVSNPLAIEKRSTLQRVRYTCAKGSLIRRAWTVLDPAIAHQYHEKTLLSHLQTCQFKYLMPDLKLQDTLSDEQMPAAIQITLNKQAFEKISLLVPLAGGIYVSPH